TLLSRTVLNAAGYGAVSAMGGVIDRALGGAGWGSGLGGWNILADLAVGAGTAGGYTLASGLTSGIYRMAVVTPISVGVSLAHDRSDIWTSSGFIAENFAVSVLNGITAAGFILYGMSKNGIGQLAWSKTVINDFAFGSTRIASLGIEVPNMVLKPVMTAVSWPFMTAVFSPAMQIGTAIMASLAEGVRSTLINGFANSNWQNPFTIFANNWSWGNYFTEIAQSPAPGFIMGFALAIAGGYRPDSVSAASTLNVIRAGWGEAGGVAGRALYALELVASAITGNLAEFREGSMAGEFNKWAATPLEKASGLFEKSALALAKTGQYISNNALMGFKLAIIGSALNYDNFIYKLGGEGVNETQRVGFGEFVKQQLAFAILLMTNSPTLKAEHAEFLRISAEARRNGLISAEYQTEILKSMDTMERSGVSAREALNSVTDSLRRDVTSEQAVRQAAAERIAKGLESAAGWEGRGYEEMADAIRQDPSVVLGKVNPKATMLACLEATQHSMVATAILTGDLSTVTRNDLGRITDASGDITLSKFGETKFDTNTLREVYAARLAGDAHTQAVNSGLKGADRVCDFADRVSSLAEKFGPKMSEALFDAASVQARVMARSLTRDTSAGNALRARVVEIEKSGTMSAVDRWKAELFAEISWRTASGDVLQAAADKLDGRLKENKNDIAGLTINERGLLMALIDSALYGNLKGTILFAENSGYLRGSLDATKEHAEAVKAATELKLSGGVRLGRESGLAKLVVTKALESFRLGVSTRAVVELSSSYRQAQQKLAPMQKDAEALTSAVIREMVMKACERAGLDSTAAESFIRGTDTARRAEVTTALKDMLAGGENISGILGGLRGFREGSQDRDFNSGRVAENIIKFWLEKPGADGKSYKDIYEEEGVSARAGELISAYDTARQETASLERSRNESNLLEAFGGRGSLLRQDGSVDVGRTMAFLDTALKMKTSGGVELDAGQKIELMMLLCDITTGMNTGTGKTYPIVLDAMARKIALGDDARIRIIAESNLGQYATKGNENDALFRSVGLEAENLKARWDSSSGNHELMTSGMRELFNSSDKVLVSDSATIQHLVNEWRNSAELKIAMLKANCTTIDEFHQTIQSKISAIVADNARDFNPSKFSEDAARAEIGDRVWSAVMRVGDGITVYRDRDKFNASRDSKACILIGPRGVETISYIAGEKFKEAGVDLRVDKEAGVIDGGDRYMLERALYVKNTVSMSDVDRAPEATRQEIQRAARECFYGLEDGTGKIRPMDESGERMDNSVISDVWTQYFIMKKEGLSPESISVSETAYQASTAIALAGTYSFMKGASASIEMLGVMTEGRLGSEIRNISAGDIYNAISVKIMEKLASGKTLSSALLTRDLSLTQAEQMVTWIKAEKAEHGSNHSVIYGDITLDAKTADAMAATLKGEGYAVHIIDSRKVIDGEVVDPTALAEGAKQGDIFLVARAGMTGLNYGRDLAKCADIADRFNATMLIGNADLLKADVFTQFLGRIGRYGENASYKLDINFSRMAEKIGEFAKSDSVMKVFMDMAQRSGLTDIPTIARLKEAVEGGTAKDWLGAMTSEMRSDNPFSAADKAGLLLDAICLNSYLHLADSVSKAAEHTISDTLNTMGAVMLLRNIIEMPGVLPETKAMAQAKLREVLAFNTPAGNLAPKDTTSGEEGLGYKYFRDSVSQMARQTYAVIDYLKGNVKASDTLARNMIDFTERSVDMIADGDRTGKLPGDFESRIADVKEGMTLGRSSDLLEMCGVLKNFAGDILPSHEITNYDAFGRKDTVVSIADSARESLERAGSDKIGKTSSAELVDQVVKALSISDARARAVAWNGFVTSQFGSTSAQAVALTSLGQALCGNAEVTLQQMTELASSSGNLDNNILTLLYESLSPSVLAGTATAITNMNGALDSFKAGPNASDFSNVNAPSAVEAARIMTGKDPSVAVTGFILAQLAPKIFAKYSSLGEVAKNIGKAKMADIRKLADALGIEPAQALALVAKVSGSAEKYALIETAVSDRELFATASVSDVIAAIDGRMTMMDFAQKLRANAAGSFSWKNPVDWAKYLGSVYAQNFAIRPFLSSSLKASADNYLNKVENNPLGTLVSDLKTELETSGGVLSSDKVGQFAKAHNTTEERVYALIGIDSKDEHAMKIYSAITPEMARAASINPRMDAFNIAGIMENLSSKQSAETSDHTAYTLTEICDVYNAVFHTKLDAVGISPLVMDAAQRRTLQKYTALPQSTLAVGEYPDVASSEDMLAAAPNMPEATQTFTTEALSLPYSYAVSEGILVDQAVSGESSGLEKLPFRALDSNGIISGHRAIEGSVIQEAIDSNLPIYMLAMGKYNSAIASGDLQTARISIEKAAFSLQRIADVDPEAAFADGIIVTDRITMLASIWKAIVIQENIDSYNLAIQAVRNSPMPGSVPYNSTAADCLDEAIRSLKAIEAVDPSAVTFGGVSLAEHIAKLAAARASMQEMTTTATTEIPQMPRQPFSAENEEPQRLELPGAPDNVSAQALQQRTPVVVRPKVAASLSGMVSEKMTYLDRIAVAERMQGRAALADHRAREIEVLQFILDNDLVQHPDEDNETYFGRVIDLVIDLQRSNSDGSRSKEIEIAREVKDLLTPLYDAEKPEATDLFEEAFLNNLDSLAKQAIKAEQIISKPGVDNDRRGIVVQPMTAAFGATSTLTAAGALSYTGMPVTDILTIGAIGAGMLAGIATASYVTRVIWSRLSGLTEKSEQNKSRADLSSPAQADLGSGIVSKTSEGIPSETASPEERFPTPYESGVMQHAEWLTTVERAQSAGLPAPREIIPANASPVETEALRSTVIDALAQPMTTSPVMTGASLLAPQVHFGTLGAMNTCVTQIAEAKGIATEDSIVMLAAFSLASEGRLRDGQKVTLKFGDSVEYTIERTSSAITVTDIEGNVIANIADTNLDLLSIIAGYLPNGKNIASNISDKLKSNGLDKLHYEVSATVYESAKPGEIVLSDIATITIDPKTGEINDRSSTKTERTDLGR
ncbi:MAG: hypothetical protein PHS46_08205, partial [Candidatus Omnitrophica bacterium]|nr:hypothetical protein [Candidatus Omnitrophota bacterium]